MSEGFILLHRQMMEWGWYKDAGTLKLFIHCLLRANHKDAIWMGQEVKRGSFITSISKLSSETGLTEKKIRTSLSKLEKTNEVGKRSTRQNTVITVVSYDKYQDKGERRANEGQTNGKRRATNNNDNNEKQILKDAFDGFWKFYGKKSDKQKCFDKWMQNVNLENIDHVRSSLKIYIAETQKDITYRKNPLTWLNGKCWLDYPINAKPEQGRINPSWEAN